MRHLRIFDAKRSRLFDLPNVERTTVTMPGALVIDLNPYPILDDDEGVTRLVLAPGHWAYVQEVDSPPPAPAEAEAPPTLSIPATGFLSGLALNVPVTGGYPVAEADPDEADDDEAEPVSDAMMVHRAMQIVCVCLSLRCPVVLNPSTDGERRKVRRRMFGKVVGEPVHSEPRMQCSLHVGHDPMADEHRWKHGEWIYGPAQHHPECPRHPERYNRNHSSEGQPNTAGLTTEAQLSHGPVLPATVEQLTDQIMSTPDMVDEIFRRHEQPEASTDRLLVRPYATGAHRVVAERQGNSGPGFPVEPVRHAAVNQAARTVWHVCGVYAPDEVSPAKELWCHRPVGHDQESPGAVVTEHEALQGVDPVRW
jgi:hypothetical protein